MFETQSILGVWILVWSSIEFTTPKTDMTGWKIHHLKMYFLLNMFFFSNVMLVFRDVYT